MLLLTCKYNNRKANMTYDLKIETKDDMLLVKATGTRSFDTILSMSQDILKACVEKDIKRVLIDVIGLEGRLGASDAFEVTDKYFPKIRNRSVITHCALVDLKEFESSYRFFENLAVNRGFVFRIFSDMDKAIAWLKT
jgi:hypothetical protein